MNNSIEIKCTNPKCGKWFTSPIFFGDMNSFDTSTLVGNTVQCPYCRDMTGCNKENMRIQGDEGGFRGDETV